MKTVAGVWVDHRKSVVVIMTEKEIKTREILSKVEKQLGRFKGKRSTTPFESQQVQADDRQQRGFTKHLKAYYEKVLPFLLDADSVLIFGPGEAKGELHELLKQHNHSDRVVVMESADKMTNRQIASKVHHYFADNHNG